MSDINDDDIYTKFGNYNVKSKAGINSVLENDIMVLDESTQISKGISQEDIKAIVKGTYQGDKIAVFGITHYKYKDAKSENLVTINGSIKVHKKCAEAFKAMQEQAKKDGINLQIVSGFRSEKYQITVFKKKFIDKENPTPEEMKSRLRFSAPSGFSEHHTGLAIDINSTEQSFANTKEYKWLKEHAQDFGFEISFPQNGHQGLGFEPWHWRYVGDEESKEVFKVAREEAR